MGERSLGDPPDRLIPQNQPVFTMDKKKKLTISTNGPKYLLMSRISNKLNNTEKNKTTTNEDKEPKETLANVSPFLIKKVIDCICGSEVEICKKIRDGNILIKTKNNVQATKLVTLTSLAPTILVDVREHTTLNFSKGVIYSNDLRGIEEKEILKELNNQNVTDVKKILKKVGTKLVETGLIIITLSTLDLPEHINIGYEKVRLRPYVPYPLRCKKCLRFGHTTNSCENKKMCPNCALEYHFEEEDDICENPSKCVNCSNNNIENNKHNAFDKVCPVFLREKEIQAIVSLEKVDRKKAIETYKKRHQNGQTSFSSVTKTPITKNNIPTNNNNNNSDTLSFPPRNQENYNDIEYHSCSNSQPTLNSPKTKTITLLPRNTSNKMKRRINKQLINKEKKLKTKSNADDFESSD